ncbi:hypothetical protein BKA93DRAFT_460195 [Sparassis latifolia]|uniref:Uncharacterized protein n=1 Tax=Sparassis crispa TaxID=139825 RepID=A0A401H6K6_9APHY|nr:hypothetical protein SCP_1800410 [Sparassis crispa]GBE90019.1 hypothetical protein SCP_1800410 [Sparassis crispa]
MPQASPDADLGMKLKIYPCGEIISNSLSKKTVRCQWLLYIDCERVVFPPNFEIYYESAGQLMADVKRVDFRTVESDPRPEPEFRVTIGIWTFETYPQEPHVLKPQTSKLPMLQTLKLQMSKLAMLRRQTLKPQLKQTSETTIAVEVPVGLLDRRLGGALEFHVHAEVVCQICSPDENQKINDADLEFTAVTLQCDEKVFVFRPT